MGRGNGNTASSTLTAGFQAVGIQHRRAVRPADITGAAELRELLRRIHEWPDAGEFIDGVWTPEPTNTQVGRAAWLLGAELRRGFGGEHGIPRGTPFNLWNLREVLPLDGFGDAADWSDAAHELRRGLELFIKHPHRTQVVPSAHQLKLDLLSRGRSFMIVAARNHAAQAMASSGLKEFGEHLDRTLDNPAGHALKTAARDNLGANWLSASGLREWRAGAWMAVYEDALREVRGERALASEFADTFRTNFAAALSTHMPDIAA